MRPLKTNYLRMKVLHCCLAAFYIDDFGYQENILPKMHKLQGHEVKILASTENYINKTKKGYVKPASYFTSEGIPITRIPFVSYLPNFLVRKLRIYENIYENISNFKPDIIFIHDCQFMGVTEIRKYLIQNPEVKVFADCHTDFINSGKNWISKNILHKVIYKWCVKRIEPYVLKFYGTLPLRAAFYNQIYGVAINKLDVLPFGADYSNINFNDKENIRLETRKKLGIKKEDFVLLSGGKIDKRKNIDLLINSIEKVRHKSIKLIVFGKPSVEMEEFFRSLVKNDKIIILDWVDSNKIYELIFAADLGVFPGTHSVIWEQALGFGLPCIFKKWEGMEHLDFGGNCLFLKEESVEEITSQLNQVIEKEHLYEGMLNRCTEEGPQRFSYYNIAEKAIQI